MNPDDAWLIGSVVTACIGAAPAYLAAKRGSRKAESTEHAEMAHEVTRTVIAEAIGPLTGRLDEMHRTLAEVRDWQAEHTTEHAVTKLQAIPRIELRKGK